MKRLEQFDVFDIPCSEIFYDEVFNCRGEFTLQSVQELAGSIRDEGLKFPVVVQPACDVSGIPAGYPYRLVTGHRRFKAISTLLRSKSIPSRIATGLSEKQARSFNLLENLERKELNQLEEAVALRRLYPQSTIREIADEVHRSTRWVNRRTIVLDQPVEVQQMLASGRLSLNAIWEHIRPMKSKSAKISLARRLTEDSEPRRRQLRREYIQLTRPRPRKEINAKIAYMLELGLHDVAPILTRFAAWCGRGISDEDIDRDLAEFLNQQRK